MLPDVVRRSPVVRSYRQCAPPLGELGALAVLIVALERAARDSKSVYITSLTSGGAVEAYIVDYFTFAKVLGTLAALCMATALLPAPHASAWALLSGRPLDLMLRLHRMCGRISFLIVVAHAAVALYAQAESAAQALEMMLDDKPNRSGAGIVYGTIAAAVTVLMAIGALWPVRRLFYNIFLATHRVFFLGIAALTMTHAASTRLLFAVPLALLAVDKMGRLWQRGQRLRISSLAHLPGDVVELRIALPANSASKRLSTTFQGTYAYVMIPHVAKGEWHPFSIVDVVEGPATASGSGGFDVVFCIKAGGSNTFGRKLLDFSDQLSRGRMLGIPTAYVEGPYDGVVSAAAKSFSTCCACVSTSAIGVAPEEVILVAGGVGITPMLPMAEALLAQPSHGLKRVSLIWACPDEDAFTKWFPGRPAMFLSALHGTALGNDALPPRMVTPLTADDFTAHSQQSAAKPMFTFLQYWTRGRSEAQSGGGGGGNVMGWAAEDGGGNKLCSPHIEMRHGRPDLDALVAGACGSGAGSAGRTVVMACGPDALVGAARRAAVKHGHSFHSELFHR